MDILSLKWTHFVLRMDFFFLQNAHLLLQMGVLSYKHIRPKDLGFCPPRMDYFLSSKRTFGRSKNEEQFLQNYYSLDPTAVAGSDRDVWRCNKA